MKAATTLDVYFAWRLFLAFCGVFATVVALVYTLDFVELVRRAGDAVDASAGAMARLALYRTPAVVERTLPFAVLFGAMITFLNLSRRLELVVARSAGISVWQILRPALTVAVLVGVFSVTVYNPISASWRQQAIDIETRLFPRSGAGKDEDIWLRQRTETGYGVIKAGGMLDSGRTLTDVTFFLFHPDGSFRERITTDQADLVGLQWRMRNAAIFPAEKPNFQEPEHAIATNLRPDFIRRTFTPPDSISFWRLRAEAEDAEAAGLDATRIKLQFQRLLAQPLLFVAMVIIASTVSLRFFRMGGVARLALVGVSAGFVLYVVKKLVEDLGSVGLLGPFVAAWTPAILGCLVGCWVLLHQEDG